MNRRIPRVVVCCLFTLSVGILSAQDARPFSSPRSNVVARLQAHITIALLDKSATPEETASTLTAVKLEIESNAPDILADPVVAPSKS